MVFGLAGIQAVRNALGANPGACGLTGTLVHRIYGDLCNGGGGTLGGMHFRGVVRRSVKSRSR